MIGVVFYMQYKSMGSSSRGIQSGGVILDLGDLCDVNYMSKLMRGNWKLMYQVGRSQLKDLISMRLEEFENIFYPHGSLSNIECIHHLLGFNGGTSVFRKEITDKYGPKREKIKTTSVYEPGSIITGVDKMQYMYMGDVASLDVFIDRDLIATYSGHMYIPIRKDIETPEKLYSDWLRSLSISPKKYSKYFLKSKRKAVAGEVRQTGSKGLQSGEYNLTLGKSYMYKYERQLKAISKMK